MFHWRVDDGPTLRNAGWGTGCSKIHIFQWFLTKTMCMLENLKQSEIIIEIISVKAVTDIYCSLLKT